MDNVFYVPLNKRLRSNRRLWGDYNTDEYLDSDLIINTMVFTMTRRNNDIYQVYNYLAKTPFKPYLHVYTFQYKAIKRDILKKYCTRSLDSNDSLMLVIISCIYIRHPCSFT